MESEVARDGGWKRPEDAGPYPREWDRFEGLKAMPDGRVPTFCVRDLAPDLEEEAVAHMLEHYAREEQMARATHAADDPASAADLERLWRDAVRGRASLAAFADGPGGPRLAGLNLLGVVLRGEPPMMVDGPKTRPMFVLMNEMLAAADVFERFGVSSYLVGLGLSVHPDFRGQGVALRLLRARRPLCAALRVPLTVTAFSGPQSQKQAQRAGFQVLQTRRYADFALDDGQRPFKDATWPHLELQAQFYGPREDETQREEAALS